MSQKELISTINKYNTGGDPVNNIEIKDIILYSKDDEKSMMSYFDRLIIIENIYNILIDGNLRLSDLGNQLLERELSNDDIIKIKLKSKITKKIFVLQYKILNIIPEIDPINHENMINITFTNLEYDLLKTKRSFGWQKSKNKLLERIKKIFKIDFFDEVKFNINSKSYLKDNIAFPWMSFIEIIDYINKYIESKKDKKLLIYSTLNGIILDTFDNIISRDVAEEFFQTDNNNLQKGMKHFNMYNLDQPNYLKKYNNNAFGFTDTYYDFKDKTIEEIKIGDTPDYSKNSSYIFNNKYDNNIKIDKYYNNHIIKIFLGGFLERSVGLLNNIKFIDPITKKDGYKYLDGTYITEEIQHDFTKIDYYQTLTMIRT